MEAKGEAFSLQHASDILMMFWSLPSKLTLNYYRVCLQESPGISNVAFPAFDGKVTSKFNRSPAVKLRKISTDDNSGISPIFIPSGR